jgi:hypothetical protein
MQKEHAEFASFHESYVRHYIGAADTKAAAILGLSSALLTFGNSKGIGLKLLSSPEKTPEWIAGIAGTFLLGLCALLCVLVITPKLKASVGGFVFFADVAKLNSSYEYEAIIESKASDDLTIGRIRHCYDLSVVASRKYLQLRSAVYVGFPGAIVYILLIGWMSTTAP